MATLRFEGVQVTDAGQRAIGSIGSDNNRGYGSNDRGPALRKLERDGLVRTGLGPLGRSWGLWLTDLGESVFTHLYGWSDAPVAVGDRVSYVSAGTVHEVLTVNMLEVRMRAGECAPWTMSQTEFTTWWSRGWLTPHIVPTVVCPVSVGDVLAFRGERIPVAVSTCDGPVTLSDGRTYSVGALVFLTNMGGVAVVPRTMPRLSRIKSTSGARRRNRG